MNQIIRENATLHPAPWLLQKVVEESSEVVLAFMHHMTKNTPESDILEEIGHLKIAIQILEARYQMFGHLDKLSTIDVAMGEKLEAIQEANNA